MWSNCAGNCTRQPKRGTVCYNRAHVRELDEIPLSDLQCGISSCPHRSPSNARQSPALSWLRWSAPRSRWQVSAQVFLHVRIEAPEQSKTETEGPEAETGLTPHMSGSSISDRRQFGFLPRSFWEFAFLCLLLGCFCKARTSFEPAQEVLQQIFAV